MMRWIAMAALAACSAAGAVAADSAPAAPELTVEQILEKNAVARGGLEAWRKIQTMVWVGHMESPGGPAPQVPFVLQQKRPNKTRFELNAMGEKSLRVFDGKHGWKAHPSANGRPDVRPFTAQELRFAQEAIVIDSPLIDHDAKRVAVELGGVDRVEGRKAYRLILRTPSGERHNAWVDAQSFLDIKYDRTSYNAAGAPSTVSVYYRDYRSFDGVQIPATIETDTGSGKAPDKMVIEKVTLNPALDDRAFGRPGGASRRNMVTVDIEPTQNTGRRPVPPAGRPAAPTQDPGSAPK
jgi:outer membrane lipoprotein-sorting protein